MYCQGTDIEGFRAGASWCYVEPVLSRPGARQGRAGEVSGQSATENLSIGLLPFDVEVS